MRYKLLYDYSMLECYKYSRLKYNYSKLLTSNSYFYNLDKQWQTKNHYHRKVLFLKS